HKLPIQSRVTNTSDQCPNNFGFIIKLFHHYILYQEELSIHPANFKSEYEVVKRGVSDISVYERDWRDQITKLQLLVGGSGLDGNRASALDELRKKITQGPSQTTISEDKGILQAVGAWTDNDVGVIDSDMKKCAASLKVLRHIYLQNKFGSKRVWVVNLPKTFEDWPSRTLASNAGTVTDVKQFLASKNEHFTDQQRRHLGSSTQKAMAWCQKAGMVLANAASGGTDRDSARTMVRRWFAEDTLSDDALNQYIGKLDKGFKDVIAMLNRGNFIVTDWVPFRGTTDADERDYLASEAFTFASNGEGLDVVYIESNFFVDNPGNIANGAVNWTRIIVHELTHLVCGTEDVLNGQARYAWYGIGPHAGYPGSDCIRNADNWAFFAADCGEALQENERNKALKII
ncbi:MAG: M35 family metallo-endopeptidase, partial [Candidatus Polarisedimenticolaceae bacterium]|nr:M35 family metallo-endopeptidase [Candidatus Polarisedimenticolaceae bacterium]